VVYVAARQADRRFPADPSLVKAVPRATDSGGHFDVQRTPETCQDFRDRHKRWYNERDADANKMLKPQYRQGYEIPEQV